MTTDIRELAAELVLYLRSSCVRIEIAGSIRCGKANPKDIELVVIPLTKMETNYNDMFGGDVEVNLLNGLLDDLYSGGEWALDQKLKLNGPKYKRLAHSSGVCCDLFLANESNWGNILTIRTGPADFSRELVTRALKLGLKQENGLLWRVHRDGSRSVVECPEEADYFAALGVPWIEPVARNVDALRKAAV